MGDSTSRELVLDRKVLDKDTSLDELRRVIHPENPVVIIPMEADAFFGLLMGDPI